jgi:NADH-quinone oxidoreductase subunit M
MLYDRYHTRKLSDFGGMMSRMPRFGVFLILIALASVGLPGLNGFVGEVLCLFGVAELTWKHGYTPWPLALAATGLVWGAWYTFTMLRRLLMGPLKEPGQHATGGLTTPASHGAEQTSSANSGDLVPREILSLAPIAVLCVVLGVYPQPVLRSADPDLSIVAAYASKARERVVPSTTARVGAPVTVQQSERNR